MAEIREILAMNRFDPDRATSLDPALAERLARRRASFGASSVLFYDEPVEMVRAEGAWMYDSAGRRYLDVYNNVPSVGHCHPHVVAAMARQTALLNIHTRYLNRVVEDYAARLLDTFDAPLSNLVMTCTGSEANDLAMRIARVATGAQGFVVTRAAYHGNTALVSEVSPSSLRRRAPADFVRTVPAPATSGDVGGAFAAAVAAAIADLVRQGHGFAGLLVDTIFSSDGVFADPAGFVQPAAEVVRRAGGLFIADEVQPGFGRTGGGLWGFARHGIQPDIVTMGKPMGNGYPMGGVVTRPDLLSRFCAETGYFNTFGGSPVAAAAGLAVLEVIEAEGLIANAHSVGVLFRAELEALHRSFPEIAAVRGAGLFIGVDFCDPASGAPDAAKAGAIINALKSRGILIGAAGLYGHTLKIRPPLCFTATHVEIFITAFRDSLADAG